jgi:AraC-like DNA-binding protein
MNIAAPLLNHLIDFAFYRGMNRQDLKNLLLEPETDLCLVGNFVTAEEYLNVLQKIIKTQSDPNLGLSYGFYLNLNALGLIHTISLSTTSIEQALKMLTDFLKTNFPLVQIEQVQTKEKLHFELKSNIEDFEVSKQLLDSTFCFIFRELSMMINVENIVLTLPYEDRSDYLLLFKKGIQKEAFHTFSVDLKIVNGTINQKNFKDLEILLPQFLKMLSSGEKKDQNFTLKTRNMILNMCSPELPTLEQVSKQFAMSQRTFQRKLTQEGRSFRSITNGIKKELAAYLREGNKMKTQDIALILGYSETSAYLHAAKSWYR